MPKTQYEWERCYPLQPERARAHFELDRLYERIYVERDGHIPV